MPPMTAGRHGRTVIWMKGTFAILWTLHGRVHSGSLEVLADRILLGTRGRTFSMPISSIASFTIERGPAVRLSGLAVLTLQLEDGVTVRVASLEGTAVLHELARLLVPTAVAV
jgi:hypothetical protein